MVPKLRLIVDNKGVRYLFVGGLSFVIEMGLILLLHNALGVSAVISVAISFWIGLVISFLLQKLITFKDRSRSTKKVAKQSALYGLLVGVNYLFTLTFVAFFETILGIFIARTIALIITTLWNFVIYKKVIFKEQD